MWSLRPCVSNNGHILVIILLCTHSSGSTPIWTHRIVTAWELCGNSQQSFIYYCHYKSCCNPIEVDFSVILWLKIKTSTLSHSPHTVIIIFTGREEEKGSVTFWQRAQQQSSWLCHALREARCHLTPQTPGKGDAWEWEGTCQRSESFSLLIFLYTKFLQAQSQLQAAGEILHTSMMYGHKPLTPKHPHPSTPSSDGESTKENSPVDSQLESSGETSKRTWLTSVSHVHTCCDMARVAQLMEKNDVCEDCKEQKMVEFHASDLERHDRAIDIQEWTSTALLQILRQDLLN